MGVRNCTMCVFQTQWKDMLVAYGVRERNLRMTRALSTTVFLSMWLDGSRWLGPGGGLQGEEYEGVCFGYVNYEIPIKHMDQLAMLELREKLCVT